MKLSVIAINYNNVEGLKHTIESVISQTYKDFEYIIIDGGSTDGSFDIIKKYADKITYWVSESDKGIYNAMNKGVSVAHGEYCQFLNSGDYLYNNRVYDDVMKEGLTADICTGDTLFVGGKMFPSPQNITLEYFIRGTLSHPSSFIKKELLIKEPYDESLKISSDRKFFMKECIINNASYKKYKIIVAVFDITGISSVNYEVRAKENELILEELIPKRIIADYYKFIGKTNDYFNLFYTLYNTPKCWTYYNLNLLITKIVLFNKSWIKQFKFHS